ncbi:LacI family DNA-binding transcriptional regulator [uncultured Tyzzerella sp.]|uniref:LacI family DNA-binding transcriptional regulator n=1 Tax=uncultured Tyzzerella sp. TaxID=2321398 RepID=UPI002941EDCE|nr:LacI family DNA-binding transcriptional regulator [uncultured Tyzzerella sp.]
MVVKIKDIAEKLNISVGTVSKGLNGASDISYELTQLILDTAIEMGYKPKKMLNEDNKKLCIFITNMEYKSKNDFGYDIILGFKRHAIRDNWKVFIEEVTPDFQKENDYDKYMLSKGYNGAFFVGFALNDLWLKNLQKTKTPTVLLDNYISRNFNVGYVGTDNIEAFDISIEYLKKLGHSKIGFFSAFLDSMVANERYEAFFKAMSSHNLPVNENLISFGYYTIDSAKYTIPKILKHNPTAILCGSDVMAYGAIKACEELGIKVPNDISIIGFDDIDICKKSNPKITTIKQNRLEIGKCAYISLEGIMRNVFINKTTLRPNLVKRESTKKIN